MKLKQNLDVEKMPTDEEIAMHISELASGGCGVFSYGAVIALDRSKRKFNRQSMFVVSVYGDDLEHAISEFMERDESSGLSIDDFDDSIATILYQAAF